MRSPAQLVQLATLHATTRGRRVNPAVPEAIEGMRAGLSAGRWSRRALARRIGTSDTTLARWLRGIDNPDPQRAIRLKEALADGKEQHDAIGGDGFVSAPGCADAGGETDQHGSGDRSQREDE